MIECAWDATHNVVVLHRPQSAAASEGNLRLAIAYAGGDDQYFAGFFPAGWRHWVVQAPAGGDFRLSFYAGDAAPSPLGDTPEPVQEVLFERDLTLPPGQPVPHGRRLCGRLYGPRAAVRRVGMSRPFVVATGHTLESFLEKGGLRPPFDLGITVAACRGGAMGPASHPFRERELAIPVCVRRAADREPLPPDAVHLMGFEEFKPADDIETFKGLMFPVVEVDLTAFGEAAEDVRLGLTFFHRPFLGDGDQEVRRVHGESLRVVERDGRRLVQWPCRDACHRDVLGVHFAGGHPLAARTVDDDPSCLLRDPVPPGTCFAVWFLGNRCMTVPSLCGGAGIGGEVTVDRAEVEVARFCSWIGGEVTVDQAEAEVARFCSWIGADERLHSQGALSGAQQAEACTLFAYVELLGEAQAPMQGPVAALLRPLGLGLQSFTEFVRRPDVAFAVVGIPELRSRLDAAGGRLRAPQETAGISLVAFLAAALEGGDGALAAWVDAYPGAQPLLWRLVLAGVPLSRLMASGLTPDGLVAEPQRLAANLDLALNPEERRAAAAVIEDLGQDPAPLAEAPRHLSDVEPLCRLMGRAEVGLADDLARATRMLAEAGLPAPAGLAQVKVALARSVADATLLPREALAQRVMTLAPGQGPRGGSRVTGEVQTRGALQAMVEVLEGRPPPAADRSDCAGLTMAWCRGVLSGEGADWPVAAPLPAPLPAEDQRAVEAELDRLEHRWLHSDGRARWVLPDWTAERLRRQRAKVDEVAAGAQAVRAWLGKLPVAGGAEGVRMAGLIERVERVAPWVVAHRIWREATVKPVMEGRLSADLSERLRSANRHPPDWEAVAAAIATELERP